MNPILKKAIPFIVAMVVFYVISAVFFKPEAFDGKVLQQVDNIQVQGMNREAREYYDKDGQLIQWTNTIFSGMPTTMIFQKNKGNLVRHFYYGSMFWKDMKSPSIELYVAMMFMFLGMILLGVDWRIAILGGIGFAFGSYHMELLEAGHATKMMAIGYFGLVIASAWYAYNRNLLLGASLFALSLGMQVYANHYQITYYTLIIILILGIVEFIRAIKNKTLPHFAKATALMAVFGVLCALTNASKLWSTYEYSKETIRGKSDLAAKKGVDGLGKDYVFGWSYGIAETMTLLVPDFEGGGSSQSYEGTKTYKFLKPQIKANLAKQGVNGRNADVQVNQQVASLFYSGDQPFVGMGVYMGIIVFFLMILGVVMVDSSVKWWLLASMLVMLSIAWGRHFPLNEVWYNIVPLFNKFRSLSMALSLVQGLAAMLAVLGLQAYFRKETTDAQRKKGLKIAGGITLGILVLTLLASGMMDYSGPKDARYGDKISALLQADRLSLLRKDVGRSIIFVLLAIGALYMYLGRKISALVSVLVLTLLVTIDLWSVDARIIHPSKFKTPKSAKTAVVESAADKQIKQDKDPHYRVLDLTRGDPFTNAMGAYFHKMVGGYHPAKLMRYNDVIEKYLRQPGKYLNVLGMLNTKYIIQNQGNTAVPIPLRENALGNAWFVKSYRTIENADKELAEIGGLNPKDEAIFDQAYAKGLDGFKLDFDSTATIKLTHYNPDIMEYEYSAKSPQLVVFSEIYYPESKGWSLSLGDQRIPILKADYLLRAAVLPAGTNQKLVMKFHPKSYYLGEKISWVASIILLLSLFAGFYYAVKNHVGGVDLYSLPEEGRAVDGKKGKGRR
ncbi:MAG TPA: hypothetical protein ENK85_02160 [Saprospiraceae bacterium]|nr:hypothetical protein [Saprospiraceae bacterium]